MGAAGEVGIVVTFGRRVLREWLAWGWRGVPEDRRLGVEVLREEDRSIGRVGYSLETKTGNGVIEAGLDLQMYIEVRQIEVGDVPEQTLGEALESGIVSQIEGGRFVLPSYAQRVEELGVSPLQLGAEDVALVFDLDSQRFLSHGSYYWLSAGAGRASTTGSGRALGLGSMP